MKNLQIIFFVLLTGIINAQPNFWNQKYYYGGGVRSDAVGFSINGKGYILTGGSDTQVTNDLWEYDTLTNTWNQKANFPGGARETAVAFAIGNKGYIGTGKNWSGTFYNDFWEYDPSTDTWTQKANVGGVPRYSAVGFSIGNKGYIGTGASSGNHLQDIWEYDPTLDTWTQKALFPGAPRYKAVGISIGNKGYIGGGIGSGVSREFWEFDPVANTWVQKEDIIFSSPQHTTCFTIGNFAYIHNKQSGNFAGYDPSTDNWVMLADLPIPRDDAVGFCINNKGYIGTGNNNGRLNDFWCYTPCSSFPIATITASGPTTFCAGDSVILTASNADSYSWSPYGETTQSITATSNDNYSVHIHTACGSESSNSIAITVHPVPPTPTITQFDSLLTSSSPTDNQWYFNGSILPGETDQSLVATYIGIYTVVVTNSSGCSDSASYMYNGNPNFLSVPICIVTVDSSSQYNIIVWDKSTVTDIDTFLVLREVSTNNYQPIAAIPYDSLSQFVDTVRTLYFPNTGDPNLGTYRYKLQCIDTIGNYSQFSPYHNTIFFIDNGGVFTWLQPYEIENSSNPVSSYVLMRDDFSNGNWHDIGSVSGSQNFITDPQYSTYIGTATWRVRAEWSVSCSSSKSDFLYSLSNYNTYFVSNDIKDFENEISIYPNPSTGIINIKGIDIQKVEVFNIEGNKVYFGKEPEINLNQQAKGIYIIKVTTAKGVTVDKVILE